MVEKQGRWSDICVTIIPEVFWEVCLENLRNIWSMSVAFFFEKRVGIVILGTEPLDTNKSKYSWNFSRSVNFNRFKLKSPPVIIVEFSVHSFVKIFENGFRNRSIEVFELFWRGGWYTLARVILFGRASLCLRVMSIKSPSQCCENVMSL